MAKAQAKQDPHLRLAATQAQFVFAELDMAITFCNLALCTNNRASKARNVKNALKGYRAALRFAKVRDYNLRADQGFQEKVENLKALLLRLGQKADGRPSPTDGHNSPE